MLLSQDSRASLKPTQKLEKHSPSTKEAGRLLEGVLQRTVSALHLEARHAPPTRSLLHLRMRISQTHYISWQSLTLEQQAHGSGTLLANIAIGSIEGVDFLQTAHLAAADGTRQRTLEDDGVG